MMDLVVFRTEVAWPVVVLLAWLAGEYAYHRTRLPRICIYAVLGFMLAPSQLGLLPQAQSSTMLLLANIAFGLMLFECGYRINLRWLLTNPWFTASCLMESALTFSGVYLLLSAAGLPMSSVLLIAALSMASSPATIIRVINEQRSSGQVTERVLHLAALNCVLAVFVFKSIIALVVFKSSGSLWEAGYNSLIVLSASMLLGLMAGALVSAMSGITRHTSHDSTLAFAITLVCLVTLAHAFKVSPILAALTFGLSVRHRRIILNPSQRGFGSLGELLSVFLFVFIAASLEWRQVMAGISLGLALIVVRQISKIVGISLFARASGISLRKGMLTGLAAAPISAFVILVLEQSRHIGIHLVEKLAPLAAAALILEILGPVLVQRALIWAQEAPDRHKEN